MAPKKRKKKNKIDKIKIQLEIDIPFFGSSILRELKYCEQFSIIFELAATGVRKTSMIN